MKVSLSAVFVFGCALAATAAAQSTAPAAPATRADEPVKLDPFQVSTSENEGYVTRSATSVGRIAQRLDDIPQTVVLMNAALIEDIAPTTAFDVLNYVAGATGDNAERYSSDVTLRGFSTGTSLRNGFLVAANLPNVMGAVENDEQIEVIKGAAGVLYGQSLPGGLINYVTKSALFHPENSLTTQSYFLHGTSGIESTFDSTGPLGGALLTDKTGRSTLAYRLTVTEQRKEDYHQGNDRYRRDDIFGKLTWAPVQGLEVTAEYEYYHILNADPGRVYILAADNGKPPSQVRLPQSYMPIDYQQNVDGMNGENESWQHLAQLYAHYTKDLGVFGTWTLRAAYSYDNYYEVRDRLVSAQPRAAVQTDFGAVVNGNQTVTQADINAGRLLVPSRQPALTYFYPDDVARTQWDLTGQVETGPLTHSFLFGTEMDLGARNSKVATGQQTALNLTGTSGLASPANFATWLDNASHTPITINWGDIKTAANPTGEITPAPANAASVTGSPSGRTMHLGIPFITHKPDAYYAFDNLGLFHNKLIVTLGVRHDTVRQVVSNVVGSFEENTFREGFVFKAADWVNLYAIHSESFTPNDVNAAAALGHILPPEQGTQNEGGLRFFALDNKFRLQIAAFDIKSTNIVVANVFTTPIQYTFINGVENKGFDGDLTYSLSATTQLIASFAHYNASSSATPAQELATPGITQVPLINVSPNQFTLRARYAPSWSFAPGAYFTAGYRWTDTRPGGNTGSLPAFYMPSYGIVDLGTGYVWKHWKGAVTIRNVFNKYAYRASVSSAAIWPETPRTGTVSLKYTF